MKQEGIALIVIDWIYFTALFTVAQIWLPTLWSTSIRYG